MQKKIWEKTNIDGTERLKRKSTEKWSRTLLLTITNIFQQLLYHMVMILKQGMTFIPGIWTHSTAVPVAFDRNSVKVSSAMDKSLETYKKTMSLKRLKDKKRT